MRSSNTFRFRIAYGVDLSAGKALIVRAGRKGVQTLDEFDLTPNRLAGIDAMARNERAAVVCPMPVKSSFTQWIEAPFPSTTKARRVFDSILDLQIPFGIDQCSRIFLDVGQNPSGNVRALAVGARWEQVQERVAGLAELGLDPELLDHEGLALWQGALGEMPPEQERWRVVLYLGADRIVGAVGLGKRFEFARHSDMQPATEGLTDRTQAAQAARGLIRILNREDKSKQLEIIWAGPAAQNENLRGDIADEFGKAFDVTETEPENARTFLARSLALRALSGAQNANLRQARMLHPHLEQISLRRQRRLAGAALAVGALLCAGNLAWTNLLQQRHDNIQSLLQARTVELTGIESVQRGMEIETAAGALQKIKPVKQRLLGLFHASHGSETLMIADFAARQALNIERMELDSGSLTLAGTALDWDACRSLSDYISTMGYAVELQRNEAGSDERVHFRIDGARDEL